MPVKVTVPRWTVALSPACDPVRCSRRSTAFCRSLSDGAFWPNMVRSLQKRKDDAVRMRRRSEGESTVRGRVRTVKEDCPSALIVVDEPGNPAGILSRLTTNSGTLCNEYCQLS